MCKQERPREQVGKKVEKKGKKQQYPRTKLLLKATSLISLRGNSTLLGLKFEVV